MLPKKILDLFCKQGGASMGMHLAFPDAIIVGVDKEPQPLYPFEFVQGDALNPPVDLNVFDFIWASPPCQAHTKMNALHRARGNKKALSHQDLIPQTRTLLNSTNSIWVIENVPGAKTLHPQFRICGHWLGHDNLMRHQLFESNVLVPGEFKCSHRRAKQIIGVYGERPDGRRVSINKEYKLTFAPHSLDEAKQVMGIDWMDWAGLTQAIPPSYSKLIIERIYGLQI